LARADLPSGTVTFLFTDVEGSTRLLHELGAEAYAAALAEHRRVIREACASQGGVEVDTQGDAFFFSFADAPSAVAAASAFTYALASGQVQVRVGVHTGTPLLTKEGYIGDDVHFGARVAASGHGGQILVSSSTAAHLPSDNLSQGHLLLDLGEHRLKDISEPVSIFQLGDGSFPPLKTISNTNLPRPASSFVGREQELAQVLARIEGGARLLTLTGPGGSGKTRLALEAAASLVPSYKAGVFWVGLATVRDPELVVPTVAHTIGAQDGLAAHIGAKEILLLLDNLEQVVAVAPELAALVEACPNLTLLVTSRELLRVRGEVEYEVQPLADSDAAELFCARAHVPANQAVQELCRRLDNMPLALELAAARTKALNPEQILERLGERLDLFRGGRDADPRQVTLRATIEWSYDLLPPNERELFARLAVFAGGCTLEAAGTVGGAELDTLQSLAEKSLVRHTGDRFWMLETIREFATERLAASGEEDDLRRRHAEHYLEIAEAANLSLDSLGRAPQRHELVIPEQDNLRAAIDWATGADTELGLRLAVSIENFWITHDPREGLRWFEALLAAANVPDRALLARAWRDCGGCAQMASSHERARGAYERSLQLYRALGDENGVATVIFRLGVDAAISGDFDNMRRLYGESLEMFQSLEDPIGELQVLGNLGGFEFEQGNTELGREMAERSLVLGREAGWTWWEAAQLASLAEMELESGRVEAGEARAAEALEITRRLGDRRHMVWALAAFAWAVAARGDEELGALLWTGVEAEESRGPIMGWDQKERNRFAAHIPDLPRSGRVLSLDEAVEYALSSLD
jgi:predicted ATPase/class 3 adenylate cyclase